MENDFIKVSRTPSGNDFYLEVYFSKINSTVRIALKESDFLVFLLKSGKLYNENDKSIKINFSQKEFDELILSKQQDELDLMANKFAKLNKIKPQVEVTIFIPDEYVSFKDAEAVTNTCGDFMEAMGFELETEDEPVFGSFFKRLKYVFSSTIGEEDLVELYGRGKKALELKYIELPTADQTEKLASAAEKLVKSLECVEEGVIRCGALIVLKKTINGKSLLIVQQLSTELIIILDKNPKLVYNVNTIYELLTGDVRNDIDDTNSQQMIA